MTRNQIRSRCTEKIEAARQAGRTAFIGYLPAGFPTLQDSIQAAIELGRNGADIIEIGLPYSDPVMDGEVIQKATAHALNNGFHTDQVFQLVNDVTAATDAAVVVMTYWNLVSRLGVTEFARRLAEAGGAGLVTLIWCPKKLMNGSQPVTGTSWTVSSSPHRRPRMNVSSWS